MIKSILVPLAGMTSDNSALAAAHAAAVLFDAHVDGLHVRSDPVKVALQSTGYDMGAGVNTLTPELIATLKEGIESTAAAARRNFEDFCARTAVVKASEPAAANAPSAGYEEVEADSPLAEVVAHARTHELTVCGRTEEFTGLGVGGVGDILVRSGRPVLIAADTAPRTFSRNVAIAWKDTAEAGRALTAALPFLAKAQRVAIITAAEDGDQNAAAASAGGVAATLKWHGMTPEVRCIAPGRSAFDSVMEAAHAFGADLLVMGGYGHSRAREFVFGGFTRRVLGNAPLPVLMAH